MPTNWPRLVRDLTAQGATPTQYGAQLARLETWCCWCTPHHKIADGARINGKVSHGLCERAEREFRKKEGL